MTRHRFSGVFWQALPWLVLLGLVALNLLRAVKQGPNDDAFITFRVARNLASGSGPVFNPGERVLSITTPGYMLLLAASALFTHDFITLGLIWNGLGLLAAGALLIFFNRPRGEQMNDAVAALAATVTVALTFSNLLLTVAVGMETPLYLAALLAVFASYGQALRQPAPTSRWLVMTALAAAVAFMLRPDGILAGLVVGLHWLATRRRVPWRALVVGLAVSLPWVLFAWVYYGSPIPNTLAAKITQGLPDQASQWGAQWLATVQQWARANPLAAVLSLVGLAGVWSGGRAAPPEQVARRLLTAWAALYMALHGLSGVRGYFWYYVPLLVWLALLAGEGSALLLRWLAGRLGPARRTVCLAAAFVLLLGLLVPIVGDVQRLVFVSRAISQRETAYAHTAALLHDYCQQPGHEPVGMAEIGVMGYYSDCRILDFAGLLQRDIAHLRASPSDKITWAIKAYNPPTLVLAGSDGFPHAVAGTSWLRTRYEPYDIQDEGGFQSVIYRRAPGPADQRALGAHGYDGVLTPVTTTLFFPLQVTPAITLHVFLPADSSLTVTANDQLLMTLAGSTSAWQDVRLSAVPKRDNAVTLTLTGTAGDQAAAASWLTSNALPALHYFNGFVEAAAQPRPNLQLDQGDTVQTMLARPAAADVVLDIGYRDRPGVQMEVLVDGEALGVVGGTSDRWQVARFTLPPALAGKATVQVELRSLAQQFVRVYYAALVDPEIPAYTP